MLFFRFFYFIKNRFCTQQNDKARSEMELFRSSLSASEVKADKRESLMKELLLLISKVTRIKKVDIFRKKKKTIGNNYLGWKVTIYWQKVSRTWLWEEDSKGFSAKPGLSLYLQVFNLFRWQQYFPKNNLIFAVAWRCASPRPSAATSGPLATSPRGRCSARRTRRWQSKETVLFLLLPTNTLCIFSRNFCWIAFYGNNNLELY